MNRGLTSAPLAVQVINLRGLTVREAYAALQAKGIETSDYQIEMHDVNYLVSRNMDRRPAYGQADMHSVIVGQCYDSWDRILHINVVSPSVWAQMPPNDKYQAEHTDAFKYELFGR
ncbi:hypothetical protein CRH09_26390 [Nocardia terpenica]|uniref:PASTA domain-containing protein n=2 Tax=Nocardia terpenica TaxID=455432 RepID=A0A291RNP8_9NOCA|nr:hypothetical protein CRH09_26390 [Nocardia terpenica]